VEATLNYAGISRSFLYQILNSRRVASHMIGRARLIDRESLDAFISSAPVGDFDCGTKIAKRRAAAIAA
jgi:excisionase family DNA binding protein